MGEERVEKTVVRQLWLQAATTYSLAFADDSHPLFLTLAGAEGRDIQLLIDNGLLQLTESGAIASSMKHRVIAVESSARAAAILQKRFPGLKILEHAFNDLVSGNSLIRFPTGEHEAFCRARVVNLDLNEPLRTAQDGPVLDFQILTWIRKLCQIHAQGQIAWTLCLTLHGEVLWTDAVCSAAQKFLVENFKREQKFATQCKELLGEARFNEMNSQPVCRFDLWSSDDQQKLLMVFVPKKIAQLVHHEGWRVETEHNLRYGARPQRAPMVTWVIHFVWDASAFHVPDDVYRTALSNILTGAGRIAEDGSIS